MVWLVLVAVALLLLCVPLFLLYPSLIPSIPESPPEAGRATTVAPPVSVAVTEPPIVTIFAKDSPAPPEADSPVCSGEDDQNLINQVMAKARDQGIETVQLSAGRFVCTDDVDVPRNVRLLGEGPALTELSFKGGGSVHLMGKESSLEDCEVTGSGMVLVTASGVTVRNVSATSNRKRWATFAAEAPGSGGVLERLSFIDCTAVDSGTNGFMLSSEDGSGTIRETELVRCRALNCGRESRFNEWVVGFSLPERAHVENITVKRCYAEGSWESGFHAEGKPDKDGVHLIDCTSVQNGQRRQSGEVPDYGAGFLVSTGMRLVRCRSISNEVGYLCTAGDAVLVDCNDTGSRTGMLIQDIDSPAGFEMRGGGIAEATTPIRFTSTGEAFTSTTIRGVIIARTDPVTAPAVVVKGVPNPQQIRLVDSSIDGYLLGIVEAEAGQIVRRNVTINAK